MTYILYIKKTVFVFREIFILVLDVRRLPLTQTLPYLEYYHVSINTNNFSKQINCESVGNYNLLDNTQQKIKFLKFTVCPYI